MKFDECEWIVRIIREKLFKYSNRTIMHNHVVLFLTWYSEDWSVRRSHLSLSNVSWIMFEGSQTKLYRACRNVLLLSFMNYFIHLCRFCRWHQAFLRIYMYIIIYGTNSPTNPNNQPTERTLSFNICIRIWMHSNFDPCSDQ